MRARIDTPLKRVLREQGRRQDWLAAQVGARPEEISRWANGLHVPADRTQRKIACALGKRPEELWPATTEPDVQAAA